MLGNLIGKAGLVDRSLDQCALGKVPGRKHLGLGAIDQPADLGEAVGQLVAGG